MLSVERIDVFFLIGRRRSAAWDFFFLSLAISAQLTSSSSRLRTALRRGRHRWARAGDSRPHARRRRHTRRKKLVAPCHSLVLRSIQRRFPATPKRVFDAPLGV